MSKIFFLTFVLAAILARPGFSQTPLPTEEALPEAPPTAVPTPLSQFLLEPAQASTINTLLAEQDKAKTIAFVFNLLGQDVNLPKNDTIHLLLGLLAIMDHDYSRAEDHLGKIHLERSPLGEYVRLFMARTLRLMGRSDQALDWLEVPTSSDRKIESDIFWERIETLIMLQKWYAVTTLLEERQKSWLKNESEQEKILFYQGKEAWIRGYKTSAQKIWRTLLVAHAGNIFENEIFNLIQENGVIPRTFLLESEWLQRATKLTERGLPLEALKIYESFKQRGKNLDLDIAKTLYKAKKYQQAATLFQQLLDQAVTESAKEEILPLLASSYARSDQFAPASEYYRALIKMFPKSREAAIAEYKLLFILFDSGDYKKAEKSYGKLLKSKHGAKNQKTRWSHLWCNYRLQEYEKVLEDLDFLQDHGTGKTENRRVLYWKARVLDHVQKKTESQSLFRQLVQTNATDYYGFLSQKFLDKNLAKPSQIFEGSALIPQPRDQPTELLSKIDLELALTDGLARAVLLSQIGLADYAFDESAHSVYREQSKNAEAIKELLILAGNYQDAGPYPRAYPEWVQVTAKKNNIDADLVFALMKQESNFNPTIQSPALAIGLLQIIPQTAHEIAATLNKTDFHYSDLYDPKINIEFGTWYFKKRLDEFNGNLVHAIASYNAGPDAVRRWQRWGKGLDADEFVELIPYEETNDYVKKVLTHYWMYKR